MLRRWCWGIWGLVVVSLNKPGLWQEQPGTDCYCFLRRVGGRWHGGRSVRFHGTFEGSTLCCPLFCCASFSVRSVLCSSSAERRLWYCLCNPPTHCVSRVLYRDLGSCVIWGLVVVSLNKPGLWQEQPGTDCYCFLRRVGGRWHGGRSVRFHGTFEGSTLCCPLFCCASFSVRSVLCSSSAERRLWYCLCNPPTHCVSRVLYRDLGFGKNNLVPTVTPPGIA